MTTFKNLFLSVTALILCSCQNNGEAPAVDTQQLTGRWELVKAWRNHRPTETLTDTYYEFLENGTMKTNLTFNSGNGAYPFVVSGSKIIQKSKPDEVVFKVEEFSDTLLTLSMVLKKYPFKIVLRKVEKVSEFNLK
jgi:hypothetical protein